MTETALLYLFSAAALAGALTMLVARHPMRVALGLIGTMLSLACLYALLGVHVIAVFQIMIYVGAVMVFMVYAIMLLDVRDPSFTERYSPLLWPGLAACVVLAGVLIDAAWRGGQPAAPARAAGFGVQPFSAAFVSEYWLCFELTSVLMVVAVLAAVAVVKLRIGRRDG
jgi:NADH-quinone oxidoreductase subunit J